MNYFDSEEEELHEKLISACKKGNLDQVKYLLTSPELDTHASINYSNNNNTVLTEACWYGHLEIVDYLLTSPDLIEKADIHFNDDQSLIFACYEGKLDVVKYLLTSTKLMVHANINARNTYDCPLKNACDGEKLEVIKYLLESESLNSDSILDSLHSLSFAKHLNVIKCFIFNESRYLCPTIRQVFSNGMPEEMEQMLKTKELLQSLNTELEMNNPVKKKAKL
jgi:ankyrin repeat protein